MLVSLFFNRPTDTVFVFVANVVLIASCCAMFVEAQRAINMLGGDPQGSHNSAFTCSNVVWMVVGVLYMAFVAYLVFMFEG